MTDAWVRNALDTKRTGSPIDGATWTRLIDGYVAGTIVEAPIAALLMAAAIRGLDDEEIAALTFFAVASPALEFRAASRQGARTARRRAF